MVVDDGSTDDTFALAQAETNYIIKHEINLGKGAAIHTGLKFAFEMIDCDHAILMDGDEQHSPDDLPKFIDSIVSGEDLSFGVRTPSVMPTKSFMGNYLTTWIVEILTGVYLPDILCGYKALSVAIYHQFNWGSRGYDLELSLAWQVATKKISFSIIEIKTLYPDYQRGMTGLDGIKVLLEILRVN